MNGADAASRGGFRDSKDASELLLRLAETYQRRYLCRLNEAGAVKAASLAPLVRTHLQNKVKRLEEEALVTVKFQDPPVNTRGFVKVGHASRPFTLGTFDESSCSCGGKEVDQEPCACLVKAALISGFDVSKLLHERESTPKYRGNRCMSSRQIPCRSFVLPNTSWPPFDEALEGGHRLLGEKSKARTHYSR